MHLIDHITKMWGFTVYKLAQSLNIPNRTVYNYGNFRTEMPIWRLVQLRYVTGMPWEMIGKLLEQDYTKKKIELLTDSGPKMFQKIMGGKE